jgi:enoyl-CoA hydratase/carnithine racemase
MSDFENILFQIEGPVATITLNRPKRLNALTDAMFVELQAALKLTDEDSSVRVVVLTGSGGNFSAGFDLRGGTEYSKVDQPLQHYLWMIRSMRTNYQAIWNNRKPLVAKIRGKCIAGGCYLQMLCDISVAAEDSILGHPAVATGGVTGMPMWTWYLGTRKAKELLFTGKLIDGLEAERIGLVSMTAPDDELDAFVDDVVAQILTVPHDSVTLTKEALNTAADVMGLATTWRTQGHMSALARYSDLLDLDIEGLQERNRRKVETIVASHRKNNSVAVEG